MAAQKWESLIELVAKFNQTTCNFYASYLLPFSTFALQTKIDSFDQKLKGKQYELKVREQLFENWKNSNAKGAKISR
jgi:hypothetical protein